MQRLDKMVDVNSVIISLREPHSSVSLSASTRPLFSAINDGLIAFCRFTTSIRQWPQPRGLPYYRTAVQNRRILFKRTSRGKAKEPDQADRRVLPQADTPHWDCIYVDST
jgi:hypothetical protein